MGSLGYQADNVFKGFVEVMRLKDDGADILQGAEPEPGVRFFTIFVSQDACPFEVMVLYCGVF